MQRFRNAATPSSSWKKCGALFDNPDWNAIHIYIFYALKKFKWSQVSNQPALHCIGIISEREKIYWKSNALNILKTNPNKLAIVFGLHSEIWNAQEEKMQQTIHYTFYECFGMPQIETTWFFRSQSQTSYLFVFPVPSSSSSDCCTLREFFFFFIHL